MMCFVEKHSFVSDGQGRAHPGTPFPLRSTTRSLLRSLTDLVEAELEQDPQVTVCLGPLEVL